MARRSLGRSAAQRWARRLHVRPKADQSAAASPGGRPGRARRRPLPRQARRRPSPRLSRPARRCHRLAQAMSCGEAVGLTLGLIDGLGDGDTVQPGDPDGLGDEDTVSARAGGAPSQTVAPPPRHTIARARGRNLEGRTSGLPVSFPGYGCCAAPVGRDFQFAGSFENAWESMPLRRGRTPARCCRRRSRRPALPAG